MIMTIVLFVSSKKTFYTKSNDWKTKLIETIEELKNEGFISNIAYSINNEYDNFPPTSES